MGDIRDGFEKEYRTATPLRECRAENKRLREAMTMYYGVDETSKAAALLDQQAKEIERLRDLVGRLADDVEAAALDRYPKSTRHEYPSMELKFQRDMSEVYEARAALKGESATLVKHDEAGNKTVLYSPPKGENDERTD